MTTKSRQLNDGQLSMLYLVFKFRFVTSELIAESTGKQNGTAIRSRLNILTRRRLIARQYTGADRLQGRHAVYYLLPDGLRELLKTEKLKDGIADSVTKSIYKNKDMSRAFMDHCLNIFRVCNRLSFIYKDNLKTFTKSELSTYDYFPKPLPDAFLSLKNKDDTHRFFLDILEPSTPGFAINKRLKQYTEYYDSEEWSDTGTEFPGILFVCTTAAQEKKTLRQAKRFDEEIEIFSTTIQDVILNSNSTIWSNVYEDDRGMLEDL